VPTTPPPSNSLYNVHRWYSFGVDRYTRPDPAGIATPLSIYNPYVMVRTNPLSFVDPLGLDAVTDNPFFQDCFYCLLQAANWGVSCAEQAAWLYKVKVNGEDKLGCGVWPDSFANAEQSWPRGKPVPPGIFAQVHTHPTRCPSRRYGAEPSRGDRKWKIPVYTISPDGVYLWDPDTGRSIRMPNNRSITEPNRCIDCGKFPKL
jgi:RHS repeat-associated protein